MNDLIERPLAIAKIQEQEVMAVSEMDRVYNQALHTAMAVIKGLPSAQPDIVRCRDCKWFNDIGCAIRIVDDTDKPSEDDFCSFVERREDV